MRGFVTEENVVKAGEADCRVLTLEQAVEYALAPETG